MRAFLALIERDLRLALRQGSAIGTALGFYLIAVSIVPLGLGPDFALLSRIAPGISDFVPAFGGAFGGRAFPGRPRRWLARCAGHRALALRIDRGVEKHLPLAHHLRAAHYHHAARRPASEY